MTHQKKPRIRLQGDAKETLSDYYDAVHTLSEAQTNFMRSTQVLESKLEDKAVFLDIIKQMQLWVVQVLVRTVEEIESMEHKTYRELTLAQHPPDYKKIYPNATEQSRTMAAFMYYVLYEQITGLQKSQAGCAAEFRCQMTPFKRLITGKKAARRTRQANDFEVQQKYRGHCSNGRWHPSQTEEGCNKINSRKRPRQENTEGWVVRLSKNPQEIGRIVRLAFRVGGWVKPSKQDR